ncbi:hypothetical protein PHISP_04434 [Aspergillus sp. HF37]|nr:hypothetical protein PHISP_04434 [Aspergillus sp. HF37]
MGSFPPGTVFTPISLADGTFTHASQSPVPIPGHDSPDYHLNVDVSVPPPQGLGITAPFSSDFPPAMAPSLDYPPEEATTEYNTPEALRQQNQRDEAAARRSGTHPFEARPQLGSQIQQQVSPSGRGRRDRQRGEEHEFVNRLRDEGISWKVIAQMFSEKFNKPSTPAQLQMRRTRQRERPARWDENDIALLIRARDQFERKKYRMIAQKIQEFGARRVYTAAQCEAQLRSLDQQASDPSSRPSDSRQSRKRGRTSKWATWRV